MSNATSLLNAEQSAGDRQVPLLEMQGICKSFPGARALHDVAIHLGVGETLGILGENGAGKSTLIKILGGIYQPDAGSIWLNGKEVRFESPNEAILAGVAIIHQELNLIPAMSVLDNLFLGQEQRGMFSRIGTRFEREKAEAIFSSLGVDISLRKKCRELSVAEQQMVEIAKALLLNAKILVLDEPSATLSSNEVEKLFARLRELNARGIGALYISHRLEEVFEITQRCVALRNGELVTEAATGDLTRKQWIEKMVGRSLEQEFPRKDPALQVSDEIVLEAKGLKREPRVRDVSFQLKRGEILGITGLVGSGRTETARILAGADIATSGAVYLNGKRVEFTQPSEAINAGVCLLPEDRKGQGLLISASVQENFGLPSLKSRSRFGVLDEKLELEALERRREELQIKMASPGGKIRFLSGGNQQKVALAKWLERGADVFIFDEPTRGIDVGAKFEIYRLLRQLASEGKAILMITSELPEALGMSDRILVFCDGRVAGVVEDVSTATQEMILNLATPQSGKFLNEGDGLDVQRD